MWVTSRNSAEFGAATFDALPAWLSKHWRGSGRVGRKGFTDGIDIIVTQSRDQVSHCSDNVISDISWTHEPTGVWGLREFFGKGSTDNEHGREENTVSSSRWPCPQEVEACQ